MLLKWLLRSIALLALLVAAVLVQVVWFRPFSIDLFFERVFIEFALKDPELLSSIRLLEPMGLTLHNDDLTDVSVARTIELQDKLRRDLDTLRGYDVDKLDAGRKLSRDVLEHFLRAEVEGAAFAFHDFPVNPLSGVQTTLPAFMANVHQVNDKTDARHYLARLAGFGEKFDQVLEGLRYRAELGIVPQRFLVQRVLEQMKAFVATPPRENLLYTSLEDKLGRLGNDVMDPVTQRRMLNRTESAIQETVYPAYLELIGYFETLVPLATSDHGAWALPDGDEYYAYQVRRHTTTDLTPDEIHQFGLQEVQRIEAEMDRILVAQGMPTGGVGARMRELCSRADFRYPDTAPAYKRVIEDYQQIVDEIAGGANNWFSRVPTSAVEVRRIPPFREHSAPVAYYQAPSLDGSRPGRFFVNLRELAEVCKLGMRTLAYHEAIPGHHFQIAIKQELQDVPTFRRLIPFTAFSEGWALYAERLAKEFGYLEDPFDDLGRLQAEMFRAARLVVDTGLHARRWSREQAIEYMIENAGLGQAEATAEIERYLINPGQALAYKVGMSKILELRERARAAFGDRFDLRAFHDLILNSGALPLSLLDSEVDRWIEGLAGG